MASSERLADALENAERYCAINNEGVRLRISTDRGLTIGFEYLNVDRHSDRHHAEFWVVTMVRIARALTGSRLAPERITLRHLRRQIPQDVRSHLGCDVSDAAGRDEVCFPVSMSALPIVGADKHLNRLLLDYANEALGQRTSRHNSMRAQVEHHLIELLPHGRANVTEVARRLGISVRTLARAMSDEGAMFSMVLANLRQALARRYLLDEQLSITEIAWLLGHREVSSFTHAFAGWTGMTPREFRTSGPHT